MRLTGSVDVLCPIAGRIAALVVGATVLAGCGAPPTGSTPTSPPPAAPARSAADATRPGPHRVARAEYRLGDTALQVPGFHPVDRGTGTPDRTRLAGIELTAVVHYPQDLEHGPYPLVVIEHGMHATCADRAAAETWRRHDPHAGRTEQGVDAAAAALWRWPCAAGTAPIASFHGYDYLGERLAGHGFVTVSVSANGTAAGTLDRSQDAARAALVNRHLELWRQLTVDGSGPLADALHQDFRHRIDLTRVGTVGHGRGADGMLRQAARSHRAEWPAGVAVAAVVALGPAAAESGDDHADDYAAGGIPLAVLSGSCDGVGRPGAAEVRARNAGALGITVLGGNHANVNTVWAPSSGQVMAGDDVDPATRPRRGECRDAVDSDRISRQLTEERQREITAAYVTAFLGRHLAPQRFDDRLSTGALRPYGEQITVDG